MVGGSIGHPRVSTCPCALPLHRSWTGCSTSSPLWRLVCGMCCWRIVVLNTLEMVSVARFAVACYPLSSTDSYLVVVHSLCLTPIIELQLENTCANLGYSCANLSHPGGSQIIHGECCQLEEFRFHLRIYWDRSGLCQKSYYTRRMDDSSAVVQRVGRSRPAWGCSPSRTLSGFLSESRVEGLN